MTPYKVVSTENITELMHSPLCEHTKPEKIIKAKAN